MKGADNPQAAARTVDNCPIVPTDVRNSFETSTSIAARSPSAEYVKHMYVPSKAMIKDDFFVR
jgi:hypothetical protein